MLNFNSHYNFANFIREYNNDNLEQAINIPLCLRKYSGTKSLDSYGVEAYIMYIAWYLKNWPSMKKPSLYEFLQDLNNDNKEKLKNYNNKIVQLQDNDINDKSISCTYDGNRVTKSLQEYIVLLLKGYIAFTNISKLSNIIDKFETELFKACDAKEKKLKETWWVNHREEEIKRFGICPIAVKLYDMCPLDYKCYTPLNFSEFLNAQIQKGLNTEGILDLNGMTYNDDISRVYSRSFLENLCNEIIIQRYKANKITGGYFIVRKLSSILEQNNIEFFIINLKNLANISEKDLQWNLDILYTKRYGYDKLRNYLESDTLRNQIKDNDIILLLDKIKMCELKEEN